MVTTKNFVINDGANAGIYCSYCGQKLTPQKDTDTGAFYSQCSCADAKAEIVLLTQSQELEAKIDKFYAQREKQTKYTQLLAHKANMESQLRELSIALAELEEDSDEISAPEHSPRKQLEEIGNSLKMEKPKLPDFKL